MLSEDIPASTAASGSSAWAMSIGPRALGGQGMAAALCLLWQAHILAHGEQLHG